MESSLPAWLRSLFAGISAVCAYLFGPANDWIYALLWFVALDYITGVIAAYMTKQLSSAVGVKGLLKKVGIIIIVVVANLLDQSMDMDGAIRTVVILFFCANEGLSILENCAKMGIPIPQKLLDALDQLKDDNLKIRSKDEINKKE